MSAYVIASYDIDDPKGYEPYVPAVIPLLEKHGAEILVAEYEAALLEGTKRSVYVVLKFATDEAARAWYDDPAYEAPKATRVWSSSNTNIVIAKHFVPPEP